MMEKPMKEFIANEINFVAEQNGGVERELKKKLGTIFIKTDISIRAYLVRVQYSNVDEMHVALCIKSDGNFNDALLNQCVQVFKSIFNSSVHLDILYLSDAQEKKVRQLCCPFYTSDDFRIAIPDFYLSSSEGYYLNDVPISCYKRKRLDGPHKDGYILCDIDPPIIGQPYGLGSLDIDQVIIASRFEGISLFPIIEWPAYVHLARPLVQQIQLKDSIEKNDIELIAWAEINNKK